MNLISYKFKSVKCKDIERIFQMFFFRQTDFNVVLGNMYFNCTLNFLEIGKISKMRNFD